MMKSVKSEDAFNRAYNNLISGWNCSQSVLLSIMDIFDINDPLVLKSATGFGGGIGNMGHICGALTGGILSIGLLYGRSKLEENEEKERTYIYCAEWLNIFERHFDSKLCKDILKVDLRNPERRKSYWSISTNREKCAKDTVGTAAKILMQYLEEIELTKNNHFNQEKK